MRTNGMVYIGQRRPTLVGGDVAQLGHGFNLGGILRAGAGILGTGARALLGIPAAPKTAVGPNAAAFLPRGVGSGGLRSGSDLLKLGADPDFSDVISGASTTAPRRFGFGRRRRMNPLNLRALTRADRRVTRFADIARKYVSPTSPHRKVRAFKRRRR